MKKFKPSYLYKYTWEGKRRYIYKGTIKTEKFKSINRKKFETSNREKFAQTLEKVRKLGKYKTPGRQKEIKTLRHSNEALKRAKRHLGNIDTLKHGKVLERINKIKNPIKATKAYENYLERELLKRSTIDVGDIRVIKPRVILSTQTVKFQKDFYKFKEITRKSLIEKHGGINITDEDREKVNKLVDKLKAVDFSTLSKEQIDAIFDYKDKEKNRDLDFREETFKSTTAFKSVLEVLKEIPRYYRLFNKYGL